MAVHCWEGISQDARKANPHSQSGVRFWERVCRDITSCGGQSSWHGVRPTDLLLPAGRQWPRAGRRWPGHQLFLLPGMSAAGGVAGRMARCQKQPFRRVKKQAQLGEAVIERDRERREAIIQTGCPINTWEPRSIMWWRSFTFSLVCFW